jgi:catechol 2,3-dioxygenase-like lactoylglutathione lyase family enzyme
MHSAKLVPELDVTDLDVSMRFYIELLRFSVAWERPEERFVYLDHGGAQLMLEEAAGPGRRFRTGPLERPFGRGVNLQIEVDDADAVYSGLLGAGHVPLVPMEERWYRTGAGSRGHRQFVIADPDGYLLRLFTPLGVRLVEECPSQADAETRRR